MPIRKRKRFVRTDAQKIGDQYQQLQHISDTGTPSAFHGTTPSPDKPETGNPALRTSLIAVGVTGAIVAGGAATPLGQEILSKLTDVQQTKVAEQTRSVEFFFVNTLNSAHMCAYSGNNSMGTGYNLDEDYVAEEDTDEAVFKDVTTPDHSESIIMRTKHGKYVVLDVGSKNAFAVDDLYRQLMALQGQENVVIDYLIISHHHSDHAGGLKLLGSLGHPWQGKITVRNYVDKFDPTSEKSYDARFKAIDPNVTQIMPTDGQSIVVDEDLTLTFWNTDDVWKDATCGKSVKYFNYRVKGSNSGQKAVVFDVEGTGRKGIVYILKDDYFNNTYFDNGDTSKFKYRIEYLEDIGIDANSVQVGDTITAPNQAKGQKTNRKYYFTVEEKSNPCTANPNAYAILATTSGGKYAYFPNDIENVGYEYAPNEEGIFGDGMGVLGKLTTKPVIKVTETDETGDSGTLVFNEGEKIDNYTSYQKAQESYAAQKVAEYLGTNLNKLVIYQVAHHSYNNAPDAIKALELNNSTVQAVFTMRINPKSSKNFAQAKSWNFSLKNTKRWVVGESLEGIYCYINTNGTYGCQKYCRGIDSCARDEAGNINCKLYERDASVEEDKFTLKFDSCPNVYYRSDCTRTDEPSTGAQEEEED